MGVVLIVAAALVAAAVAGGIKAAQLSRATRDTAANLQQINQRVTQALNELAEDDAGQLAGIDGLRTRISELESAVIEAIGRHRTELSQVGQRAEDLTAALGEWLKITDDLRESALAERRENETRFAALREETGRGSAGISTSTAPSLRSGDGESGDVPAPDESRGDGYLR